MNKTHKTAMMCIRHFFTLTAILQVIAITSLSSSDRNFCRKIERVAIIGAGISGLSLAHALENSPSCASTFDHLLDTQSTLSSCNYGVETHIFDARNSLVSLLIFLKRKMLSRYERWNLLLLPGNG